MPSLMASAASYNSRVPATSRPPLSARNGHFAGPPPAGPVSGNPGKAYARSAVGKVDNLTLSQRARAQHNRDPSAGRDRSVGQHYLSSQKASSKVQKHNGGCTTLGASRGGFNNANANGSESRSVERGDRACYEDDLFLNSVSQKEMSQKSSRGEEAKTSKRNSKKGSGGGGGDRGAEKPRKAAKHGSANGSKVFKVAKLPGHEVDYEGNANDNDENEDQNRPNTARGKNPNVNVNEPVFRDPETPAEFYPPPGVRALNGVHYYTNTNNAIARLGEKLGMPARKNINASHSDDESSVGGVPGGGKLCENSYSIPEAKSKDTYDYERFQTRRHRRGENKTDAVEKDLGRPVGKLGNILGKFGN